MPGHQFRLPSGIGFQPAAGVILGLAPGSLRSHPLACLGFGARLRLLPGGRFRLAPMLRLGLPLALDRQCLGGVALRRRAGLGLLIRALFGFRRRRGRERHRRLAPSGPALGVLRRFLDRDSLDDLRLIRRSPAAGRLAPVQQQGQEDRMQQQ